MKIMLLGATGQLGTTIKLHFEENAKYDVFAFSKTDLDITKEQDIKSSIYRIKPDVLINCAAYTNVEEAEKNINVSNLINAVSLGYIASICNELQIVLIHFSTDYVFNGQSKIPYCENDNTDPLNQYGKSKLKGEKIIQNHLKKFYIFRISWLFGLYGNNFPKSILQKLIKQENLNIIDDQIGTPTFAEDVASALIKIISHQDFSKNYGVYHYGGNKECNWFYFANAIAAIYPKKINSNINPISSNEFGAKAIRPMYSSLNSNKIYTNFGITPSNWLVGLNSLIENETK